MAINSDPVNEEVSDQLFGGCYNIVLFFVIASGIFAVSTVILLNYIF